MKKVFPLLIKYSSNNIVATMGVVKMKLTESDKKHGNQLGLNETEMMLFKSYKDVKQLEKHHKDGTIYYSIALVRFQSYIEMAKVAGTITCSKDKDDVDRISEIMLMAEKEINNE